VDRYATSEGLVGGRRSGEAGFALASDLVIAELVDEQNRPVPPGRPSARVLVTNLFNTVQPLIRYVIADRLTRLADAPGHGHAVVAVEGRSYVTFSYPEAQVHELTVLSPVIRAAGMREYQIRQTPGGLDVDVQAGSAFDSAALAAVLLLLLPLSITLLEASDRAWGPAEQRAMAARGSVTYRVYCQTCHGRAGAGDGKLATLLDTAPANLTLIGQSAEGAFPDEHVYQLIDGRQDVASHGRREMPVWGEALAATDEAAGLSPAQIESKIWELVFYLESIQR